MTWRPDMPLSRHFRLREFITSAVAEKYGIDNTPREEAIIVNLQALCRRVLEPMRSALGVPLRVTSGYRCWALNQRVGGVADSQHLFGEAADIIPVNLSPDKAIGILHPFFTTASFASSHAIPFDQLILEHAGDVQWLHISHRRWGPNRSSVFAVVDGVKDAVTSGDTIAGTGNKSASLT